MIGRNVRFEVSCLAATPDMQRAIAGGPDGRLRVWDLRTGELVSEAEGHTKEIEALAAAPYRRLAVSAGRDATLRVWDLKTARCLRVIEHTPGYPTAVAVTPDARYAVTGGSDHLLRVWDLGSGRLLKSLEGHTDAVTGVSVTPDARYALSGSNDKTVRFWDLEHGDPQANAQPTTAHAASVAFSRNARYAFAAGPENGIAVWSGTTGTLERTLRGHTGRVTAIAATPDDRHILSAGADHTLRLWDAETGEQEHSLSTGKQSEGEAETVSNILVTEDGTLAAVLSFVSVSVLDIHARTWLRSKQRNSFKHRAALTPDGRYLVCGEGGGSWGVLVAYDCEGEKIMHFLSDSDFHTLDVVVSADGRSCAAIGMQCFPDIRPPPADIPVWDLLTGAQIRRCRGHQDSVACLALMPNGRQFLSGSRDGTIKLWGFGEPDCLATIDRHTPPVSALDVSADGRFAVSACKDDTLRVWHLATGDCLATYRCPGGTIARVVLRYPRLLVVCANGTLDFLEIMNPADPAALSSVPVITACSNVPLWVEDEAWSVFRDAERHLSPLRQGFQDTCSAARPHLAEAFLQVAGRPARCAGQARANHCLPPPRLRQAHEAESSRPRWHGSPERPGRG